MSYTGIPNQNFYSHAVIPSLWTPGLGYPSISDLTPVVYQSPKYIVTVIPG